MCSSFNLTFIIFILYLKFNGLTTFPVIDRNKMLNINDNAVITKITQNTNNNNKDIHFVLFPVVMSTTSKPFTNDNDNNNTDDDNGVNTKDNGNTTNDNNNRASNANNNNLNTKSTTQINTTSNLVSTNFTTIELHNLTENYTHMKTTEQGNEDRVLLHTTIKTSNIASEEEVHPDVLTERSNIDLDDNWNNSLNTSDIASIIVNYENFTGDTCLLDGIKGSFMWWAYPNGSLAANDSNEEEDDTFLDLSSRNYSQDDELYGRTVSYTRIKHQIIIAFSAANNQLTQAPFNTLSLMRRTLKYLSLKENLFQSKNFETNENIEHYMNNNDTSNIPKIYDGSTNNITIYDIDEPESLYNYRNDLFGVEQDYIGWATFPPLPQLLELDISNCQIEFINKDAFQNLTNLRNLYMSHNKMLQIPADTFEHIPSVRYLDLSNINAFDYSIPSATLDAILNLFIGVKIYQHAFKSLPNLEYLDLSHTKLTRNSAMAFTHFNKNMKFLSLCYTAFPMIGSAIFKNTALIFLDLSGNPHTSYSIIDDTFDGVRDTLKYFFFEKSNIKTIDWLQRLTNLRVLGLSGNNINTVSLDTFSKLQNLQVLDLSSNHVGNWYNRAFINNQKLRVLNLRDNNINIITTEMLKDFEPLEYLGIGDNDFVCDCLLREMVEIASMNNNEAECSRNILQDAAEKFGENIDWENMSPTTQLGYTKLVTYHKNKLQNSSLSIEIGQAVMERFLPSLKRSYKNMKSYNNAQNRFKLLFFNAFYRQMKETSQTSPECNNKPPFHEPDYAHVKLNKSLLKFQLLDYEDEHYWCFNETERMNFEQLECVTPLFVDDLAAQLHTLTKYVLGSIGGLIGVTLIVVIIYLKRWHIHYYYSSLKSAALVSEVTKESADKFNELDPNLVYDIFISYCQNDRQWVLEELLPNVEVADDISICMHERDFQIGLTILDNIISCMDRSKSLMLIISRDFLLSHWCQFEMHLAQHRMFEASKEQLILVFLEDIPRSRRPKTLQYLMEVKTYIKWPASKGDKNIKPDDRKLFWKRLKRSLQSIGVNNSESKA